MSFPSISCHRVSCKAPRDQWLCRPRTQAEQFCTVFFRSPSTSASGQAQKQQVSLRPTDRPPAKADISLFGDRLLRGHSPIEMNNTSDAMSSEKLSFWVKPPASKHCPQLPVPTAQARNAGLQFRVPCYLQQNCWQPLTRWSCDMIKLHKK